MDPEISPGETSAQISFQIQDTSILTSPREIHAQISAKTSPAPTLPPKKRTPEHNFASVSPPVQQNNSVPPIPQDDVIEIDDPDTIYLPLFNKSAEDQTNYLPDIIDLFIESGLVFDLTGTKKNTRVIQYRLAWYTNDEAMTARSDIMIPESALFSWNPPANYYPEKDEVYRFGLQSITLTATPQLNTQGIIARIQKDLGFTPLKVEHAQKNPVFYNVFCETEEDWLKALSKGYVRSYPAETLVNFPSSSITTKLRIVHCLAYTSNREFQKYRLSHIQRNWSAKQVFELLTKANAQIGPTIINVSILTTRDLNFPLGKAAVIVKTLEARKMMDTISLVYKHSSTKAPVMVAIERV